MASTVEISTTILVIIPAVAALAGALIGSAASVIATLIHERNEDRRAQLRLAIEAAIHDHQHSVELAKHQPVPGTTTYLSPLSAYIHYHTTILRLVAEGGLNPTTLAELDRQAEALREHISAQDTKHAPSRRDI